MYMYVCMYMYMYVRVCMYEAIADLRWMWVYVCVFSGEERDELSVSAGDGRVQDQGRHAPVAGGGAGDHQDGAHPAGRQP